MFEPAVAVGLKFQVMVLLEVAVCPLQEPPDTATVKVAVKLPLVVEGVKYAAAGFEVFCVQVPKPPPPLHVPVTVVPVPVIDAPVMVMLLPAPIAFMHWLRAEPAVEPGAKFQLRVLVRVMLGQPVRPLMVSVSVPLPDDDEVVKVAPVSEVELLTVPVPVPE